MHFTSWRMDQFCQDHWSNEGLCIEMHSKDKFSRGWCLFVWSVHLLGLRRWNGYSTCKCFSGFYGGNFFPNVNECQATQKFIRKLYIKELVREEERIEKQRLEEIEEAERKQEEENKKNGIPSRKRKKKQSRRGGRRTLVDVEEKDVELLHKNIY